MAIEINPPEYLKCFKIKGKRGHSRSATVLVKAGIWIGYAAPDKHNVSFQGLPSFKELKDNCNSMTQPFPPMIDGRVSDVKRDALCRACGNDTSPVLDLSEIQVMHRPPTKVITMTLDDKGQSGELFCILLPQRNNRSLQGLEVFRPYQLGDGGNTFSSGFELLSMRNKSWVQTRKETVEAFGIPLEEASNSTLAAGPTLTPPPSIPRNSPERSLPARPRTKMTKTRLRSGRQRSATGGFVDRAARIQESSQNNLQDSSNVESSKKRKASNSLDTDVPEAKRQTTRTPSVLREAPTPTSISQEVSYAALETPSNDTTAVLPLLTEYHAKQVLLVWIVVVDDIEYEFSHTLEEAPTFSDFLDLVLTEAVSDPQVTERVDSALMWRLTYQIPGQTKKAFTLRMDPHSQQTVYARLRNSFAQSSFWEDNPNGKIDVDVRILA